MGIGWFRDLVIIIAGLVVAGVLIFITVLIYRFYHRVTVILDLMHARARRWEGITSFFGGNEALQPLMQVVALIQGVWQGVATFRKFFHKKDCQRF